MLATVGGFMFGFGTLLTVINYAWSRRYGEIAPANPWVGDTLEWATTSPPPEYNFAESPVVASRHPLWEDRPFALAASDVTGGPDGLGRDDAAQKLMAEVDGVQSLPQGMLRIPEPSFIPLIAGGGLAVFFLGMLISASLVGAAGIGLTLVGITMWTWRAREDER
jgi:hypothetical protein